MVPDLVHTELTVRSFIPFRMAVSGNRDNCLSKLCDLHVYIYLD
jgi:hypothetical protein